MKKKILIALHDAGGAAAVAPLIPRLQEIYDCRVIAAPPAAGQLAGAPIVEDISGCSYDLLLTGTSGGTDSIDKACTKQARDRNIPVIAVLDYWSNYRRRFEDETGALAYLPDILCVMDETARAEAAANGIPADILRVTGSPRFEALAARAFDRSALRAELAGRYGLDTGKPWVLFLSQPLAKTCGGPGPARERLGYHEGDAAEIFRRNIPDGCEALVRFHPAEGRPDGWDDCTEAAGGDVNELMAACDAIVGMSTVALLDACLTGLPVLSLQPGMKAPDLCYPSRHGWIPRAESEAGYRNCLAALLRGDPPLRPPRDLMTSGAAETIVNLVAAVLKSGP